MPLKSCVCVCACSRVPEAEAKASESHVQLCSRQPRWADLLRGRGDRGGRRGGPGVVGQYLSRWRLGVQVVLCILDVCTCFQIWDIKHSLMDVGVLCNFDKPWAHSLLLFFRMLLLLLPLWSPLCERWPAATCFLWATPADMTVFSQSHFVSLHGSRVSPPRTPLPCFLSVLCPATLSLFLCLRYQITAQSCCCTNGSIIYYKVCFLWKYSRKPA